MKWYEGEIRDAVAFSQSKKAIFFVAIFGSDSTSEELETSLNSEEVQAVVSTDDFVCIRLEAETEQHRLFAAIYANAKAPSIYCITDKGIPVEIITTSMLSPELKVRLDSALKRHREVVGLKSAAPISNAAAPSNPPPVVSSSSSNDNNANDNGNQEQVDNSVGDSSGEPSFEEKVRRAKELALARQLQKQKEEEEDRKRREIERREAGKGMAELKRWQEEQEAKKILLERKKDKEEEKQLRQRLREQIAQDRAARNARTNAEFAEQSTSSSVAQSATSKSSVTTNSAASFAGQARLQFRLPDGSSQTHAFDPDSTLSHVRQYLKDNQAVPFSDFSIWVAFPRRKFTTSEYGSSLRELGLLPSAALLILPMSGLSNNTRGGSGASNLWALIAALLGYVVYPLSIAWSYFQRALPSPSTEPTASTSKNSQIRSVSRLEKKNEDKSSDSLGKGNKLGRGDDNSLSNQPSTSTDSPGSSSVSSSVNNDNQNQATKSKEKGKNSSSQKTAEGNVHRLRTTESDSDDEKATWNGNSTQQM